MALKQLLSPPKLIIAQLAAVIAGLIIISDLDKWPRKNMNLGVRKAWVWIFEPPLIVL